jgi:hypothetical protein
VPNVKMPGYSVPSISFVHLSEVGVAVLSETGAHAVVAAKVAAAISAASLHTLRMGRIVQRLSR